MYIDNEYIIQLRKKLNFGYIEIKFKISNFLVRRKNEYKFSVFKIFYRMLF
jgi:hypothetical protein